MKYLKLHYLLTLSSLLFLCNAVMATELPKVRDVRTVGDFKVLHGEVDIDAPMEVVWSALTDYNNLKRILPGYTHSKLLFSRGNEKTVDLGLKVNLLIPELRYQVRILEDKNRKTMGIERVSGDFDALNATYQLAPLDGSSNHTHLSYDLKIDFGIPVPGVGIMMRSNMVTDLAALQSYCARNSAAPPRTSIRSLVEVKKRHTVPIKASL
jgi:carbon monoxide dehydrogenase subunit G